MNTYYAKEIVGRYGVAPSRITWDGAEDIDAGEFPPNEIAAVDGVSAIATDDVGGVIPIIEWTNNAPVAPGASWVFYFD